LSWDKYPKDLQEEKILKIGNSSWTARLSKSNSLSIYTRQKFSINDVVSCYPGQWYTETPKDPYIAQYVIQFRNKYFYPTKEEAGDLETTIFGHLANFSRSPNICLEVVSLQSLINTGAPQVLIDRCRKQRFRYVVLSRANHDLDIGTELFIKPTRQVYFIFEHS
jgi:hypothetical protein